MAESPAALSAYVQVNGILEEHAALDAKERQIVMLAVSEANACDYCMAAHSKVAEMSGVEEAAIQALREGREPDDEKMKALVRFAKSTLEHRGWAPEADQRAFFDAGYTNRHVLDVITILALKTLSNYTNHLAQTPLDEPFKAYKWSKR
ncbi:MAG: carboxymuconolactone decarboxylase family protein [Opitutales bacterium]